MAVPLSKKTSPSARRKSTMALIAVFAVAILLVSCFPISNQTSGAVLKPNNGYVGEYHVVRYHLNYTLPKSSDYNDVNSNKEYVDVIYYGSIVSTEYNPQLWKGTITTPTSEDTASSKGINWNWLEIKDYKVGNTVVFTGWKYKDAGDVPVHYPGEVLSENDLKDNMLFIEKNSAGKYTSYRMDGTTKKAVSENDVMHIYATWSTVNNWAIVSNPEPNLLQATVHTSTSPLDGIQIETDTHSKVLRDVQNYFSNDPYTNILLVKHGDSIHVSGVTTSKPMTIRSEPGPGKVGCIEGCDDNGTLQIKYEFKMGGATIIDDIGFNFKSDGKHGHAQNGIAGCGYPLIIGTGILSFNNGGAASGYAVLRGGAITSDIINNDHENVNVFPYREDEEKISTLLLIHSGTWYNVSGGNFSRNIGEVENKGPELKYKSGPNTTTKYISQTQPKDYCSTYTVLKNATVLDTFAGGSAGNASSISGSTHSYIVNSYMVPNSYAMTFLTGESFTDPTPFKISKTAPILPEWPYKVNVKPQGTNYDRLNITEGVVTIGGGSTGHGTQAIVCRDSNLYVSGESLAWDVQGGGRVYSAEVKGTANVELSGCSTITHMMCGINTDANNKQHYKSVGGTHLIVKDSGNAATVCGGGYDTYVESKYASMIDGGKIQVEIRGGTVCDVYGGGMRSTIGLMDDLNTLPIDSITVDISGGTVLGSVYGGGSGGFEKQKHSDYKGQRLDPYKSFPDSTGRSRCYLSGDINVTVSGNAHVEGNVYGGGKSVPAISSYNGVPVDNWYITSNDVTGMVDRGPVATTDCNEIFVTVCENAVIDGDVFGSGRGVKLSSNKTLVGGDEQDFTNLILISPSGDKIYAQWFTNKNTTLTYEFLYDDEVDHYEDYAKVTARAIHVDILDNATIGSCVYGAGARGPVEGNTYVDVEGTTAENNKGVQIAGSVYGGGLMKYMTGDTHISIEGKSWIGYSIYGGGDIGVRDESVTSTQVLVYGNSSIVFDGSKGAYVGKSVMGAGNSCLVGTEESDVFIPGTRTVTIKDYKPAHTMESIQGASVVDVVRSSIALSGRASSSDPSPSDMMSLYDIEDLRLIGRSSLDLYSDMHNVKGYGSYVDSTMAKTSMSNPMNSIKLSAGVMFNTAYDSVDDHGGNLEKYGNIRGYTILEHNISDDFYGAFAYGYLGSEGRFMQYKEGLLELIPFVDKVEGPGHDAFKLWTMIGSMKHTVSLVATGDSSDDVLSTDVDGSPITFELIRVRDGSAIRYTGASIVMNETSTTFVNSVNSVQGPDDFLLSFGFGSGDGVLTFDEVDGIIVGGTIEACDGTGGQDAYKINIRLQYYGNQSYTGRIGEIVLEFQEYMTMNIGGILVQVPVCTNMVSVGIYCSESKSSFAGATEIGHDMTILLKESISMPLTYEGYGTFVIPYGYQNGILNLDSVENYSGILVEMHTDLNDYGSQGWVGTVGKGGTLNSCIHKDFALTGAFSATLRFDVSGVSDLSKAPKLHFVINDGTTNKFSLTIHLEKMPSYTVRFYAQSYDYPMLDSLQAGGEVTIPVPPYTLAKTITVSHGDQIARSQYPMTYEYFSGWYRDPGCTRYFDTTTSVTENLELYAKYAFKATFKIPSGDQVVPVDVTTRNSAHAEAVYENASVAAKAAFGNYVVHGHIGSLVHVPALPTGAVCWAFNGMEYGVGETVVLYQESMSFIAIPGPDESSETVEVKFADQNGTIISIVEKRVGDTIQLSEYPGNDSESFVGWAFRGHLFEKSEGYMPTVHVLPDGMNFIAVMLNEQKLASITYGEMIVTSQGADISLPVPEDENFRGWMINNIFYGIENVEGRKVCTMTVTYANNVFAIPVYYDKKKMIDVTLVFTDGSEMEEVEEVDEDHKGPKYGKIMKFPQPSIQTGFVSWYSEGKNYEPGDEYVIHTDETVEFVPLYENNSYTYTFEPSTGVDFTGWLWEGRLYEADESIRLPDGITPSPSAAIKDSNKPVVIDTGRSAMIETHERDGSPTQTYKSGQTILLPQPSESAGFKGWLIDGRVYDVGDRYCLLNDYSPLHKLVLSDAILESANPGYTSDGVWYDSYEQKKFDNVLEEEHLTDDSVYHLKWKGILVKVRLVHGNDVLDQFDTDMRYGEKFGSFLTDASEYCKLNFHDANVRWEVAVLQNSALDGIGRYVYEGDTFEVPNFNNVVSEEANVLILYLLADASNTAITVELSPGQQYVPISSDPIEFVAVYIDESMVAKAKFWDGNEVVGSVTSTVGGTIMLPSGKYVGWISDGILYKDKYTFTSGTEEEFINFVAVKKSDIVSYVIFSMDENLGSMPDYPNGTPVQGKVGDVMILPKVIGKGNNKFIGWYLDDQLLKDYTFTSSETKTLIAKFVTLGSSESATLSFTTGGKGTVVGTIPHDAKIGYVVDLPIVAPIGNLRFAGWMIGDSGLMADESGRVIPPEKYLAYPEVDDPITKSGTIGEMIILPPAPPDAPVDAEFVGWSYNGKTYAGTSFNVYEGGNVLMTPIYKNAEATLRFIVSDGNTITNENTITCQIGDKFIPSPTNTGIKLESGYQWMSLNSGEKYYGADERYPRKTPIEVIDASDTFIAVNCSRNNVNMYISGINVNTPQSAIQIQSGRGDADPIQQQISKNTRGYFISTSTAVDQWFMAPDIDKSYFSIQGQDLDDYVLVGYSSSVEGTDMYEFHQLGEKIYSHCYKGHTTIEFMPVFVKSDTMQTLTFSTGESYMFHFSDAIRQGYDLLGWEYAQSKTVDGTTVIENVILPMGKIVKVDHWRYMEDEDPVDCYVLYYSDSRYVIVPSTVHFTAIWKNIEYTVEVQAPYEGRISWEWVVSADGESYTGGSVSAGESNIPVKVRYGDQLQFTYHFKEGSKYSFYKWDRIGEGTFYNDTSPVCQMDVIGNASVFNTMSTAYDQIIRIYNPEIGTMGITAEYKSKTEYQDYEEYRVKAGTTTGFTYDSDTESIFTIVVNGVRYDIDGVITVTQDLVTVSPYLALRSSTEVVSQHACFAFAQNDGHYTMELLDLSSDTTPEGLAIFKDGVVYISYVQKADVEFESSWTDGKLSMTLNATDMLGLVPVKVTVFGPGAKTLVINTEVYVIPKLYDCR
ncbi:MAG: InlB B-repeat-containing protein [Candidatus Methanomethylophilaceae archaeon]|nr:InlB B-repeat-containing protein [Candidatus Methanomethylophilaceae archaeon]